MMRSLYLCYFGLREPLVQTQVLPYLRQLSRSGIEVGLLTFEPNRAPRGRGARPATGAIDSRPTASAGSRCPTTSVLPCLRPPMTSRWVGGWPRNSSGATATTSSTRGPTWPPPWGRSPSA